MKNKRISLIFAGVIILIVVALCAVFLLPKLTPEKTETKLEKVEKVISTKLEQEMAPRLNEDEDLQSLYNEMISEMSEETQVQYDLLEEHYKHSEITTLSMTEETIELQITTPNLAKLVKEFVESASASESEELTTLDFKRIICNKLVNNNFETVTNTVVVGYSYDTNEELIIEETFEYSDAIYGGLLSLYLEYYETLSGGGLNEAE